MPQPARAPVRAFTPRFEREGRNWYAVCQYSRLRWKVIGVVGAYLHLYR